MDKKLKESAPIFVVGSQRSGTTMLRLMLSAHPLICIPPESTFFIRLSRAWGDTRFDSIEKIDTFMSELYADEKYREWMVDYKILRKRLSSMPDKDYAAAVSTVYRTYLEVKDQQAAIWGDKNPDYLNEFEKIQLFFPGARIVHIIRDVRAVYLSVKNKHETQGKNGIAKLIKMVCRRYKTVVKFCERYSEDQNIYHLFYEKLVDNPQGELDRLCKWLGINFSENMVAFHLHNIKNGLVPNNRLQWHANTLKPVQPSRVDAWREELDSDEIYAIESRCHQGMHKMGYVCLNEFGNLPAWCYRLRQHLLS